MKKNVPFSLQVSESLATILKTVSLREEKLHGVALTSYVSLSAVNRFLGLVDSGQQTVTRR